MKKVLMITLALMLVAGTVSAACDFGLFVSDSPPYTEADCSVTVGDYQPYTFYVMINATADTPFAGFECKVNNHGSSDFVGTSTQPNGGLFMNTIFDATGWAASGFACLTGWNAVYIQEMTYNPATGPHMITVEAWTGQPTPLYIYCEGPDFIEDPLGIVTEFGVNMDGVPADESSWGAVKSMYK
ncbi:MAG: hypothetical protein U5O15_00950 [Candidatus Krumholzibacteriota bacterium]|nr:hypothetical protein [Candidatus Krumholzibacteriota bacterium]